MVAERLEGLVSESKELEAVIADLETLLEGVSYSPIQQRAMEYTIKKYKNALVVVQGEIYALVQLAEYRAALPKEQTKH